MGGHVLTDHARARRNESAGHCVYKGTLEAADADPIRWRQ